MNNTLDLRKLHTALKATARPSQRRTAAEGDDTPEDRNTQESIKVPAFSSVDTKDYGRQEPSETGEEPIVDEGGGEVEGEHGLEAAPEQAEQGQDISEMIQEVQDLVGEIEDEDLKSRLEIALDKITKFVLPEQEEGEGEQGLGEEGLEEGGEEKANPFEGEETAGEEVAEHEPKEEGEGFEGEGKEEAEEDRLSRL